jgi:hypothetical protein
MVMQMVNTRTHAPLPARPLCGWAVSIVIHHIAISFVVYSFAVNSRWPPDPPGVSKGSHAWQYTRLDDNWIGGGVAFLVAFREPSIKANSVLAHVVAVFFSVRPRCHMECYIVERTAVAATITRGMKKKKCRSQNGNGMWCNHLLLS